MFTYVILMIFSAIFRKRLTRVEVALREGHSSVPTAGPGVLRRHSAAATGEPTAQTNELTRGPLC
jgi:hypothetical protein